MTSESSLRLIAKLSDQVHDVLGPLITDEPLALVDFPDIRNVGDSAIWLGEIAYLAKRFNKAPSYVSTMRSFSAEALEKAVPTGPIFIHGGGNFGDIWVAHQNFRERLIQRFPDRQIIQLPQSLHYQSADRAEQTARIVEKHRNFVLLARDQESKAFADETFSCDVRLCPDMALCIGPTVPTAAVQFPVLAMLRRDKEAAAGPGSSADPTLPVEDWITEPWAGVRLAKAGAVLKAYASLNPQRATVDKFNAAANERFARGVRQLSRGRAIVTDRLHVHIISLLMGKPHAVLDNNYGKIRRFMAAFSGGTDLSYQATSLDDGIAWARRQG